MSQKRNIDVIDIGSSGSEDEKQEKVDQDFKNEESVEDNEGNKPCCSTKGEKEDEYKGNKLTPRGAFYMKLSKLTKKEFNDKAYFQKVLDEENGKNTKTGQAKQELKREDFQWKKQLQKRSGGRWSNVDTLLSTATFQRSEQIAKRNKQRKEEEGVHQTYIEITVSAETTKDKSSEEVWKMLQSGLAHGTYAGETFADILGGRDQHFGKSIKPNGRYFTSLQKEILTNNMRAFDAAVIVSNSEEERKHLEEYIIHFLAEREEINSNLKKINETLDFLIPPGLRQRAKHLGRGGTELLVFAEKGSIHPKKRYDLQYICKPSDFKERTPTKKTVAFERS